MSVAEAWRSRDLADLDAKFLGLAAAARVYGDHGVYDIEKIREHVGKLADNDMTVIARAMFVAQWVAKR